MGRRYCIFAATHLPNLGGLERYTLNLAQQLIRAGNEVTVVTNNIFGLASEETEDGVRVIRFPCFNILKGRFPVYRPCAESRRLWRILDGQQFDFMIIQARFYVHSAIAARYADRRGIPHILIEHGTAHFTVNNGLLDRAGHRYEHFITRRVKRHCRHFYGVSEDCCRWLTHFGIRPEGVLYNAIDPEEIRRAADSCGEDYRAAYAPGGETVVCYAGRLVLEKGIRKLTGAVEKLNAEGVPTVLLIAGDGNLYDEIRQTEKKGVVPLGRLDFAHVAALYKSSDVFCLPTDYAEGFPTSVLEAAACGCFVVTTTNGGSKELILDDSYGVILEENTVETLAAAIRKAAEEPAWRKAAAQKAYGRLTAHFTWEKISAQVMEIAEKLIAAEGEARP